jgi:hypothetical protein
VEVLQSAEQGGHIHLTSIDSVTSYKVDLSAYAGRYVKIAVNQRAWIGWGAAQADDLTLTAHDPGTSAITGDPIAPGDAGNHRHVSPRTPWLIVRARATAITELVVKVTSAKVSP